MFEILLCSHFGLDQTSNFEIIHTGIDDRQFRVTLFLCTNHRYCNAKRALKFCPIFKLFRSCPLLKNCTYQNFQEHNSKAPLYRSMEQLGMPCMKRGEGFCCFNCNLFYFGRIKLSWYSRYFGRLFCFQQYLCRTFYNKKIFCHT